MQVVGGDDLFGAVADQPGLAGDGAGGADVIAGQHQDADAGFLAAGHGPGVLGRSGSLMPRKPSAVKPCGSFGDVLRGAFRDDQQAQAALGQRMGPVKQFLAAGGVERLLTALETDTAADDPLRRPLDDQFAPDVCRMITAGGVEGHLGFAGGPQLLVQSRGLAGSG